jgi:tetratricopeptide (TPR) repeat protein
MTHPAEERSTTPWMRQEVHRRSRWVGGAITDALRVFGYGLTLNLRKALWIARGRAESAPCQSPSDSGEANATRCEASAYWRERSRFRRVCPHLRQQPDGSWLCGVDTPRIRTFWGRAAAWWLGVFLTVWIGGSVPVWAFLWKSGVRVTYPHVVWPGGWKEIPRARAAYYVGQAEDALLHKKYDRMILNLQAALRSDPKNLAARLYLANVAWAQGDFATANDRFSRLFTDTPAEQRRQLARVWLPKLLIVGDFARMKSLAESMLADDPEAVGPWSHALIFTARQTGDAVVLAKATQSRSIPEPIRAIIAANAAGLAGQRDTALRLLAELAPTGDNAQFMAYQRVEGLLEYGAPDQALAALTAGPGYLAASDVLYFRLRAYHQMKWDETAQATIRDSFRGIDLPRLNAIATYLVRCHDEASLQRVVGMMATAPRAEKLDGTFAMLYLAAGLWGDRDLMPDIAKLAAEKSPLPVSLLNRFDRLASQPGHLGEAMGVMPLPMESVYAAYGALRELRQQPVKK